jgi:signal transduction histidine kinase
MKDFLNQYGSGAIEISADNVHIIDTTAFTEPELQKIQKQFGKNGFYSASKQGIGIPESDLNRLFQTYKQAKISPVAKDEKGTGLGLVIAKGIAEAHDGTVGVVSKEGMGSTFFFTLPL